MSSNMHELDRRPAPTRGSTALRRDEEGGRGRAVAVGAVFAAFGASLCCVGPLLFVTFGFGAGLASTFEPMRPLFSVLTFLGLAAGFYAVYGRGLGAGDARCAPGEACARPRNRTRDKVILWSATVLALAFWSFTYWSTLLI